MKKIFNPLSVIKMYINGCLCNTEPWKIVTVTSTTVLVTVWIVPFVFCGESIPERVKKAFFRLLRRVPAVSNKIKKEIDKISNEFAKDIKTRMKDVPYITCLPNTGWSDSEVLSFVEKCISLGEYDWKQGLVSGTVYYQNEQLIELVTRVYRLTAYSNPLHSDVFPGVCKMEAEVVRIAANLFHGGPDSCGTMTSGGSESIMMACKALRDFGIHERGITAGEIVLPKTAHPAFDKSALYLNMRAVHVPVNTQTMTVDIHSMERAITRNTVMLVGSVPNFPYGTADNIEDIAALGRKYNIPVHVDCCLGGFLTAFMPAAGYPLPPFDFALPGVISISADPHKFGFTPKGASIVLYAESKYRQYQYTVTTDWPGGVYASPTISGSRPGGSIAVCWATMMHFGYDGYLSATKKIISTTKYIEKKLREIEEIFLFGIPATSVIAIGSEKFHIYKLSEMLTAKGWNLNTLQYPSGIHLCVTYMHTEFNVSEKFVKDVKSSVDEIMKQADTHDISEGKMAFYGVAQSISDRTIVGDIACSFIDSLYFTP